MFAYTSTPGSAVVTSRNMKEYKVEAKTLVDNLDTAIEGKMDLAVVGVLTAIIQFVENNTEKQKAMAKVSAAISVTAALRDLGASSPVCEKALIAIAYLCRCSEDNKGSISYENAKAFRLAGACEFIVAALLKYSEDITIVEFALDAIRSMSCLELNRTQFGLSGACEAVGRCLTKFSHSPELCAWICRALGHLAINNDDNRELIGSVGACENAIVIIQKYQHNLQVCTEVCWAIRNIAPTENNRARFANEHGPECIAAVYKFHVNSEVFGIEACRALVSLLASEDDDLIPRIAMSGVLTLIFKTLKRNFDSEVLARWVFNLSYYVACDVRLITKLTACDILGCLSNTFDNIAGDEAFAEWGLRCVSKLCQLEGLTTKMRTAGLCELTTSTVQRQAISATVSGHGCQAIGELAKEVSNHERLSTAGACEAVVGALKRHDSDVYVVINACFAIHYFCLTENNVSWMGANGACECVVNALNKHIDTSVEVTQFASRAVGSLAYRDDGNLGRFNYVGACSAIVKALKTHAADALVAEYTCRAIYNLCYETSNVALLGKEAACGLVVAVLQTHANNTAVVAQACLAIHGLAVKYKIDKVHSGNTRKLVTKGAIEVTIAVMQKFPTNAEVQLACALAISSLGRLDENRDKLGQAGACELIVASINQHSSNGMVVGKLALAVDVLSQGSDVHKKKFADGGVVEILLHTIQKQERVASVVADCLRALTIMLSNETSRPLIRSETSFRQFVKVMRTHEKDPLVAKWGCTLIYTSATDDLSRSRLGLVKACETVTSILLKHSEASADIAAWGCKAMFSLAVLDSNKSKFANSDTCKAVVIALKENYEDLVVSEWACATIVTICGLEGNRTKIGSGGGCQAIQLTLAKQSHSEIVTRLACEAIYELCPDPSNKQLFGIVGICETLGQCLEMHMNSASVSQQICRAITGVARGNIDNSNKFGAAGICELIGKALEIHSFNSSFSEWSCASVTALCDKNVINQTTLGNSNACESLLSLLKTHRQTELIVAQATRAIRAVAYKHDENCKRLATAGVVGTTLASLKVHLSNSYVAENSGWILTNIKNPDVNSTSSSDQSTVIKDLYKSVAAWDLLALVLQTHYQREQPSKWIAAAIQVFADHGQLSHVPVCDSLVAAIVYHIDKEKVLNQLLTTASTLAIVHIDNSTRLAKNRLCEIVDGILSKYSAHIEPELIVVASFQLISSMTVQNTPVLDRFSSIPSFTKNVMKALYNDLESELVSKFGCSAISSLCNHKMLQYKLGSAGNFLIDILQMHKSSIEICTEVCRAISKLSHCNITNRNRLGASGVCEELVKALIYFISFDDFDKVNDVIYWIIRAIADLAANNPNNQSKLGLAGACEIIVVALRNVYNQSLTNPKAKQTIKYICWAVGNIIQLGKGPTMIIDEKNVNAGTKLGQFTALRATNTVKNTARLASAGIVETIMQIVETYNEDLEIMEWCLRAINNMSKSKSLKTKLLDRSVLEYIDNLLNNQLVLNSKSVKYWAKTAKDSLMISVSMSENNSIPTRLNTIATL